MELLITDGDVALLRRMMEVTVRAVGDDFQSGDMTSEAYYQTLRDVTRLVTKIQDAKGKSLVEKPF